MSEEEKGFVIKDRRSFDERGGLKENQEETAKAEPKASQEPREAPKTDAGKTGSEQETRPPLPEVNFSSLILSLSSSSLYHLGEVPDPETGEKKKDLALAKHAIDTISMLKEKTVGNLTEEEQRFIESVLTDLRWRYVKAK
ncbi:MAG: DUF1844 domain-containing protein [Desulfobacteraceae bacterium]